MQALTHTSPPGGQGIGGSPSAISKIVYFSSSQVGNGKLAYRVTAMEEEIALL